MKIYRLLFASIAFFLVICSQEGYSQRNYGSEADMAFETEQYSVAIDLYKQAYNKVKRNKAEKARILFRLAECYRMTNNNKQSINWYGRVIKANYPDPIAHLYRAEALKADEQYAEAIIEYNEYAKLAPDDPRGKLGAESCELAIKWKDDPTRYVVENVKKFNSRASDFSPYWADKKYKAIIFTSTREGSKGSATDGWTGQSFSDLYISTQDKKGAWSEPVPADENVNSECNEGTPWINQKANVIYFTRCPVVKKQKMGCQIYFSKKQGRGWGPADTLKLVDDMSIAVGHPALTEDELTIYFASDMQGGQGGKDIWMAKRSKKTKPFDKPVNLGPNINGTADEMFPYLRENGDLFFASNSYTNLGMGGLDIFRAPVQGEPKDGKFGKPENLKYPMNSAGDDFGIIYKGMNEEGYLSSNRKGGKGDDDIYSFFLPPLVFTLSGVIKDDSTKQIITGATVTLKGSDGTIVVDSSDATGTYHFGKTQILENTTYEIIIEKKDYFGTNGRETTVSLRKSTDLIHGFVLVPIPKAPIVLPDIIYDLARWELRPEGRDSLRFLEKVLKLNPKIVIELSSHTDARPIPMTNDTLSQRRAKSAVDFLIDSCGINPARLYPKGYGDHRPRILDKDKNIQLDPTKYKNCKGQIFFFAKGTQLTPEYIKGLKSKCEQEAAHQLNRRTEFSILRDDFIPPTTIDSNAKNVVIEINPNENIVKVFPVGSGNFEARCIVNGKSLDFKYEASETELQVSEKMIKEFLTEYRITVSDFRDKEKAFNEDGSIKENAIVSIKKITIGPKTVTGIDAKVVKDLPVQMLMGSKVLSKFGDFIYDDENRQISFDPAGYIPPSKEPKEQNENINKSEVTPETPKTEPTKPGTTKPGTTKPGTTKPGTTKPGTKPPKN